MPNISDVLQYRTLDGDVRAAVVTSVDPEDGSVGLAFFREEISGQTEYVPHAREGDKEDGKILNHDVAASGYVLAGGAPIEDE